MFQFRKGQSKFMILDRDGEAVDSVTHDSQAEAVAAARKIASESQLERSFMPFTVVRIKKVVAVYDDDYNRNTKVVRVAA